MAEVYWGVPGALNDGVNPSIIFIGDSWLWYVIGNLPACIHKHYSTHDFLVVGKNGAEAAEWDTKIRKDIDSAFKFYAGSTKALFLSGGGNDVAGNADFLKIIKDDCSTAKTVDDCYRPGQPQALMAKLAGAYTSVILKFRSHNLNAPVFMHNYDHAWPTGKGLFGPADWLNEPMEKAGVPKKIRRLLFMDLLQKLNNMQSDLSNNKTLGQLVVVKSAGTLPDISAQKDTWWANELHPTMKGFKRLAKDCFVPALKEYI